MAAPLRLPDGSCRPRHQATVLIFTGSTWVRTEATRWDRSGMNRRTEFCGSFSGRGGPTDRGASVPPCRNAGYRPWPALEVPGSDQSVAAPNGTKIRASGPVWRP
jgi:hypothetical protein